MEKTKILIATSNEGKFKEISSFFGTLPYVEFISLKEIPFVEAPEEPHKTIEENSLLKARFYAKKTGYTTIADDSGLFIDGLNGWPGVDTALQGDTDAQRLSSVMEKARHLPKKERGAYFASCLTLYNPKTDTWFVAYGKTDGELLAEAVGESAPGLPFDAVFFDTTAQKINTEMTIEEKNVNSHRGKALEKMGAHVRNIFKPKQAVVPIAIIIQDGKVLMSLRNDPQQPQFHKKWEFPGGCVEMDESIHRNILREVHEEVGLEIEILALLQYVGVEMQHKQHSSTPVQVFLLPYVCRVIGGNLKPSDDEVIEVKWFNPEDVLNQELIGINPEIYKNVYPELQKYL